MLEALLLVALMLLNVGCVWLPKLNVVPKRSPTTIAKAMMLLADGNLKEWVHVSEGAGNRDKERIVWRHLEV